MVLNRKVQSRHGILVNPTSLVSTCASGDLRRCALRGAQAGRVMMRLWASFLNNSSSRWEPIWENWPLHLELMDIVSPIYRSDFQRQAPF